MIRVFNVSIAPVALFLLLFESVLLLGAFVLATLAVGNLDPADYLLNDSGAIALALVVLSFVMGLYFQDLYTQVRVKSRVLLLQQLCVATGVAFILQGLISYADTDVRVSVRVMLLGSVVATVFIFAGRLMFGTFAGRMLPQTRLVIIGHGPTCTQLRTWIETRPDAGFVVERAIETADELGALDEAMKKQELPRLVLGAWDTPDPKTTRTILDLWLAGCEIEAASATYERACGRLSLYSQRPHQMVCSSAFSVTPQRAFCYFVLTEFVAAICFVATLPVLIVTALLLRIFNCGPVWRRVTLTGLNGRIFQAYRFHVTGNGALARTIRRLRLDGLPQFLNVLKGELAIVGPRGERPEYEQQIERHIPFYRQRNSVRPGMTGWAQVNMDRHIPVEDTIAKLEYDLYYIKNRSMGMDTLILLHTVKSMMMLPRAAQVWTGGNVSAGSR